MMTLYETKSVRSKLWSLTPLFLCGSLLLLAGPEEDEAPKPEEIVAEEPNSTVREKAIPAFLINLEELLTGEISCPICLEKKETQETISVTPCGHAFCQECLSEYDHMRLGAKKNCALCRNAYYTSLRKTVRLGEYRIATVRSFIQKWFNPFSTEEPTPSRIDLELLKEILLHDHVLVREEALKRLEQLVGKTSQELNHSVSSENFVSLTPLFSREALEFFLSSLDHSYPRGRRGLPKNFVIKVLFHLCTISEKEQSFISSRRFLRRLTRLGAFEKILYAFDEHLYFERTVACLGRGALRDQTLARDLEKSKTMASQASQLTLKLLKFQSKEDKTLDCARDHMKELVGRGFFPHALNFWLEHDSTTSFLPLLRFLRSISTEDRDTLENVERIKTFLPGPRDKNRIYQWIKEEFERRKFSKKIPHFFSLLYEGFEKRKVIPQLIRRIKKERMQLELKKNWKWRHPSWRFSEKKGHKYFRYVHRLFREAYAFLKLNEEGAQKHLSEEDRNQLIRELRAFEKELFAELSLHSHCKIVDLMKQMNPS